MKQSEKHIVVVLGMHRSGTSAVTRGLSAIGIDLGSRLNPGVAGNNEKGFFEDIDIIAFDDALLHALGHEWQSLDPVAAEELSGPIAQSFKPRAVALLQGKLEGAGVFGVKDPRFPRLLPFWQSVFGQMEVRASYIIVCRNPLSVAHSLARRDGFERGKSYYLWLEHMLASITQTAGCNRVVVDYDRLMENAALQLGRIAGCLSLKFDPASPALSEYQNGFLENALRHTKFDAEDLALDKAAPKGVVELYPALQEVAADRSGFGSPHVASLLLRLSGQHAELRPALAFVRACDDKASKAAALVAGLNRAVGNGQTEIAALKQAIAGRDEEISTMRTSASWRITAPLRSLHRFLARLGAWRGLLRFARFIYWRLPFSMKIRTRMKDAFFYLGRPFLCNTPAYRNWASFHRGTSVRASVAPNAPVSDQSNRYGRLYSTLFSHATGTQGVDLEYVPLAADSLADCQFDLRLIAFYLPQFHPIPENDEWWGKGFTEWTNVSKAVPQFEGHYQPHLPGELGFYDLRLVEIMRRQVELARQYGLKGFCFHYYWFNGRKLLQRPIEQYLTHAELALPFCICWANENWTRRWDGSEKEILMTQHHTPESDQAFIRDVAPMFLDSRYIRVNGRPLLIVYRVSLLPDPPGTMRRWREHCREHGIGEIYVAVAQSFEVTNPRSYGADAAIEFPPHQVNVDEISDQLTMLNTAYRGLVYDYRALASGFCNKPETEYVVHRTVMPGWDNEARKPGRGHCFHHATPAEYAKWLSQICRATVSRYPKDQRLVFINAWNEWAEGAHLEPDKRFGYAYLHATANVLREHILDSAEADQIFSGTRAQFSKQSDVAVVAHLYYTDLLNELVTTIRESKIDCDVFLSLRADIQPHELETVRTALPNAYLIRVANRGRDMLPFIELLQLVQRLGYVAACKIHGKKSLQLRNGAILRAQLFKALMSPGAAQQIVSRFRNEPRLGLILPTGARVSLAERDRHVLNSHWLDRLLLKLGAEAQVGNYDFYFVAGSMFWFRPSALLNFSGLMLNEHDFERELGQVDGTLAHALERLILFSVEQAGFSSDVAALPATDGLNPRD